MMKKLKTILIVSLSAFLLMGCAASIKGSVTANAPRELTKPCKKPVIINYKKNLESQWRKDRSSLVICKDRHGRIVKYYQGSNALVSRGR